jgi:hypothetical protein
LVDYPGRGKVVKSWFEGDRFLEGGLWWRRIQISWGTGCYSSLITTPAPCAVSCDVWLSDTLVYPHNPGMGLLSCHTPRSDTRQPGYSAGFEVWGDMQLKVIQHDDTDQRVSVPCDAMPLPIGQWFNLMFVIERDGHVFPFVDGQLAIRDPGTAFVMYPGFDIGIGDTHAGLITAQQNLTPEFPQGAFLYSDNFRVVRYPC